MKKIAYIAGLAGMAPAITGLVAPGAANAATTAATGTGTQAKTVSIQPVKATADFNSATDCHGAAFSPKRYCSTSIYNRPDGTQFFFHSGGSTIIPDGTKLRVTCYYSGDTGFPKDPYWDHVTRVKIDGFSYSGHVRDKWVNFNGYYPNSASPGPGLPYCG
jgi:hypothetical protein